MRGHQGADLSSPPSEELWKQADDERDRLFASMEQARARLDKKSATGAILPAKPNLRRCTWDQVMQEVRATAARWSSTPKRTSKMMVCLDKLGRNSDAFQTWLELLPGGDYGSRFVWALRFCQSPMRCT